MPSESGFLDSDRENQWAVELQGGNGRAASWREAFDLIAIPAKANGPALPSWMEERNAPAAERIDSRPPSFLAQRTRNARKGQIVASRFAPGASRPDVVDVEGSFLPDLR